MMGFIKLNEKFRAFGLGACEWGIRHPLTASAAFLIVAFMGGVQQAVAQNSGTPLEACGELLQYIEGGFASLVAAAAGLGAIVAAAVGGFKAAWALVVISIGAFILRTWISVFLAGC